MKLLLYSSVVSIGLGAFMQHNDGAYLGASNQACIPRFWNLVMLWYWDVTTRHGDEPVACEQEPVAVYYLYLESLLRNYLHICSELDILLNKTLCAA